MIAPAAYVKPAWTRKESPVSRVSRRDESKLGESVRTFRQPGERRGSSRPSSLLPSRSESADQPATAYLRTSERHDWLVPLELS